VFFVVSLDPHLKLDTLAIEFNVFDFKIDTNSRDEGRRK
jgi:hypothetical protein